MNKVNMHTSHSAEGVGGGVEMGEVVLVSVRPLKTPGDPVTPVVLPVL